MKYWNNLSNRMIVATVVVVGSVSADVWSQEQASTTLLEEIIVTAQKREQAIQDVGISITAFTGEQLEELGFEETTDVLAQVPSVQFQSTTTFSTVNIRGVSQTEFTDQHELPVATVLDGVYISSPGAVRTQLFDIERVEVLRGPQGTLFGRNSNGGLIHYISRKPTEDFEGYGDITFGSYDQVKFAGAVSGPVGGDQLLARIAIAGNFHDGYLENRIGPDVLESKNYSARGQLLWKASDDVEVLFKAQASVNDKENGVGYSHTPAFPNADGLGEFIGPNENPWGGCDGCDLLGFREPDDDQFTGEFDTDGFFDRDIYELSATITWQLAWATVTAITDYYTHDKAHVEDTDASPNPLFVYSTTHELDQFSQELRLSGDAGSSHWVAGLYCLDIDSTFHQRVDIDIGGFPIVVDDDREDDTQSFAVFGHLEYEFAPTWSVLLGARWTRDTKDLDAVQDFTLGEPFPTLSIATDRDFDNWQGKAQIEWRPQAEFLVYGGISRGTKAGGFQGGLTPDLSDLIFDEEVLTSYEAGFKSTLFDGTTQLNGSVFYYDYEDYQAFIFDQLTQAINVQNIDAEVTGAELELLSRPTENLQFRLGLSALDTTVDDVVLPSGLVVDRKMPQSPDLSVNGLVRYTVPVWNGGLSFQADFYYNADSYFTVQNAPVEREEGYAVINAGIDFQPGDGRWRAGVFVKNVTDTEYRIYALDVSSLGFSNDRYGLPRWYGVSLSYDF